MLFRSDPDPVSSLIYCLFAVKILKHFLVPYCLPVTLPIGLNSLITPYGNNYNVLIAGAVFSIIPIVILFIIFQKFFIAGMTAGGIKE